MTALIEATATSLWDVSATIQSTGTVSADDWELARVACSHLLHALTHPPAAQPHRKEHYGPGQAPAQTR